MLRRSGWLLGWLLVSGLLPAAPLAAQNVPPPLRDWQGGMLHDMPRRACPFVANPRPDTGSYQCSWPGRLLLDTGKDGGRFALVVRVDASHRVALPGDARNWPQQLPANGQPAVALERTGQPLGLANAAIGWLRRGLGARACGGYWRQRGPRPAPAAMPAALPTAAGETARHA